jgi:predicted Fe-S protein YdhL (DUF1289 family)
MLKRTPCVGICSTTYGDLVCRGCKRFAHEIVQWNAFEEEQRQLVWERLLAIREGTVRDFLKLLDEPALRSGAKALRILEADAYDPFNLAYEVLRRLQRRPADLADIGLGLHPNQQLVMNAQNIPKVLLERIDREFYHRSLAHYERSFRTPAQ